MSNHSSHEDFPVDPEIENLFKKQIQQKSILNLTDMLKEKVEELELGATGNFPEGKLTENDEGEIRIAITSHEGKVIINFGKPTAWIGFTKEQARDIGTLLIEKADEL